MIASVDKMSSSLSRLKKTQQNAPTQNGGAAPAKGVADAPLSDDEKIRRQLSIDVRRFSAWITELYGAELKDQLCDLTPLNTIAEQLDQNTLKSDPDSS